MQELSDFQSTLSLLFGKKNLKPNDWHYTNQ
jgi:hypothetical protein